MVVNNGFLRGKTPRGRQEAMQRKDALIAHLIAENARLAARDANHRSQQILLLNQLLALTDAIEQEGYEVLWHHADL